jgi:hypothetical protein
MTNDKGFYRDIEKFSRNLSFCKLSLLCLALSLIWHYILYGVTFWFDFGKDDDYFFFSYDKSLGFENHPQWGWWYQLGRYGSAEIWQRLSLLVTDLDDLLTIRVFSLFMSSFSMTLLALAFIRIKSNILFALFVSALIFSLPAIALNFTYILGFPSTVAWTLSLLGFLSAFVLFGNRLAPTKFGIREILGTLLAIGFLCSSIIIYQMSVFFFLVPCAYSVLFGHRTDSHIEQSVYRKIWTSVFPMVMISVVALSYYVYHKLIYLPRFFQRGVGFSEGSESVENSANAAYKFETSPDLFENLQFYFDHTVPRIFDIVNFSGYPSLWMFIAGLILLSLVIGSYTYLTSEHRLEHKKPYDAILIIFSLSSYFFLASVPIVAQGTHGTYRVILVMSAIVFLVFVWAARQLLVMIKPNTLNYRVILSCGLLVMVLLSTHVNVVGTARSEAFEVEYVKTQVRQFLMTGKSLHRIHFIQPGATDRFTAIRCDSEFFCGSSRNGAHFAWTIKAIVLEEIGEQKNIVWGGWAYANPERTGLPSYIPNQNYSSPIVVTYTLPHEPLPREEGMLVIDLTVPDREEGESIAFRQATVREPQDDREMIEKLISGADPSQRYAKKLHINYTRRNAFDGGIAGAAFWEASNFPIELILDFRKLKKLHKYTFYSDNAPKRMPKAWKLEALDPTTTEQADWSKETPIYLESQKVNVVRFNENIYSIPVALKLEIEKLKKSEILNFTNVFVMRGNAFNGKIIAEPQFGLKTPAEVLILDSITVNIIQFAGKIYSVPQSIGTISIEQWRDNEVAFLPGVFNKPSGDRRDHGVWVEIDSQIMDKSWKKNENRTFSVASQKEYKSFRWTFTEGFDGIVMRIYEITVD